LRLLSVVCSKRRRGNSELIAGIARKEGEGCGASVETIRLGDYSITECDGCMRCIFKDQRCHLDDDFYELLKKFSRADGLFLVAPTYVLSIPGMMKLVIDRYLLMYPCYQNVSGRPAISVGVAGLPDWNQFQLPLMNLLLLSLGFRILDSFMAYGAGPGEALLDTSLVRRVGDAVRRLCVHHEREHNAKAYESCISDRCPVCPRFPGRRCAGACWRHRRQSWRDCC